MPSPGSASAPPSLLFPREVGIPILGMGCTKPGTFKTFHWEPEGERIPLEVAGPAEGSLHSRGKKENAESALSFLQNQGNPGVSFAVVKGICPQNLGCFLSWDRLQPSSTSMKSGEKRKSGTSHIFCREQIDVMNIFKVIHC